MSDGRFGDWQRAQGWTTAPLNILRIVKHAQEISVEYQGTRTPDITERLRELAQELTESWAVPVAFRPYHRDAAALVRGCISAAQPALAALLDEGGGARRERRDSGHLAELGGGHPIREVGRSGTTEERDPGLGRSGDSRGGA